MLSFLFSTRVSFALIILTVARARQSLFPRSACLPSCDFLLSSPYKHQLLLFQFRKALLYCEIRLDIMDPTRNLWHMVSLIIHFLKSTTSSLLDLLHQLSTPPQYQRLNPLPRPLPNSPKSPRKLLHETAQKIPRQNHPLLNKLPDVAPFNQKCTKCVSIYVQKEKTGSMKSNDAQAELFLHSRDQRENGYALVEGQPDRVFLIVKIPLSASTPRVILLLRGRYTTTVWSI